MGTYGVTEAAVPLCALRPWAQMTRGSLHMPVASKHSTAAGKVVGGGVGGRTSKKNFLGG